LNRKGSALPRYKEARRWSVVLSFRHPATRLFRFKAFGMIDEERKYGWMILTAIIGAAVLFVLVGMYFKEGF
jgi:hypothetical protein